MLIASFSRHLGNWKANCHLWGVPAGGAANANVRVGSKG
jgi:hypothetical protein